MDRDACPGSVREPRKQHAAPQIECPHAGEQLPVPQKLWFLVQVQILSRDQSATGTNAGTGGTVFGWSNKPAT